MAKNNSTEKRRVLFFDDEKFISGLMAQNLEMNGWDITFVDEINELFMELRSRQFDVLILDIMAPIPQKENKHVNFTSSEIDEMEEGMNTGVVLANKIWAEIRKEQPILFLSAKQLETEHDYLLKPVFADELEMKLHDMLNS